MYCRALMRHDVGRCCGFAGSAAGVSSGTSRNATACQSAAGALLPGAESAAARSRRRAAHSTSMSVAGCSSAANTRTSCGHSSRCCCWAASPSSPPACWRENESVAISDSPSHSC
eukprot:363221-Chlamydomonas_euryale.AAC.35